MDLDRIPGGHRVHEAMAGCWQVNPYHQDLMTAVLPLAVGQHPAFPRALHRGGAITGLELGVDVADVRLTTLGETDSSLAISGIRQVNALSTARDQVALDALILASLMPEPLRSERRQPGRYLRCQGALVPGGNEPAWLLAGGVRRPTAG